MALKHVNAVIVGAGAGGGGVGKELAAGGLSVVLLERGKWLTANDCRKDDLRNQRTPALGNSSGPDEDRNPRVVVDLNGRERVVLPSEGSYSNNAACVGGGTFTYGAQAWRYQEKDFRMASTYGVPEGSTLSDWPVSYAEMEPYYEKAEYEIGVSGDVSEDPFHGPRRKPLPMPPLPVGREHTILKPAAQRLGLHPFDIPMLRNSVPYGGRTPCMQCRWCVGFACEVNAKCGTQNTAIPAALATGNCQLRTGCMAREVMTGAGGRVTGVAYYDADDRLREQTADIVIVSSAAVESARLLLNSKSRMYPAGLFDRGLRIEVTEQPHSVRSVAFLGDSPRREVGQSGVESGDHDVAESADLMVSLGQEAEHLRVVGRLHRTEARRTEGSDGHRKRVVRVVLVGVTRAEDSDPRGQRRRHIEDLFARVHQLLGQQVAQATSRLDSPGALAERFRPGQQLRCLLARSSHSDLGQLLFVAADGYCRVGRLVGVDPDDPCHEFLLRGRVGPRGPSCFGSCTCSSFEPLAARTGREALR